MEFCFELAKKLNVPFWELPISCNEPGWECREYGDCNGCKIDHCNPETIEKLTDPVVKMWCKKYILGIKKVPIWEQK